MEEITNIMLAIHTIILCLILVYVHTIYNYHHEELMEKELYKKVKRQKEALRRYKQYCS